MLAHREQLERWRRLLDAAPPDDRPDAAALALSIATARGRPFLVAAVGAVDAIGSDDKARAVLAADAVPLPPVPMQRPASKGADVADAVWNAYLRWRLGMTAAGPWLRRFIDGLSPTALVFGIDDNPEPWWQNEMVILHACHSFALRTGEPAVLEKTLAAADFHLREIQPDHATNEPWAIHAYASHPDGNVTAETLLHAGFIQHGGALGPVGRLIARDAGSALAAYLDA